MLDAALLRHALILGLISAIGPFAIDMYLPAMPQMAQALGASAGEVQMSLTAFFVALGLCQMVYGPLSDRFGRRVPLMVGLGLFGTFIGLLGALAEIGKLIGAFSLATGGSDPSEAIRMLVERDLPLQLWALIDTAYLIPGFKDVLDYEKIRQLRQFMYERLAVNLREQGYTAQEVDAVLANQPQQLSLVPKYLAAVRAFAALPEAPALAAANKRVTNILKKAGEVDAHVNPELLQEQAEKDLYVALQRFVPEANAQFLAGDYTGSLQTLAVLRAPVDAFFDDVMVNAEQIDLRLNRQGLLKTLHDAMNRVADLSRLAA